MISVRTCAAEDHAEEVLSRDDMLTTVSIYWHFAGWEQLDLVVQDIRAAVRVLERAA